MSDKEPPVFITKERSYTKKKGDVKKIRLEAIDPQNGPVKFSLAKNVNGVSLSSTGLVTWASTTSSKMDVTITDQCGKATTDEFVLNVLEEIAPAAAGVMIGIAVAVVLVCCLIAGIGVFVYKKKMSTKLADIEYVFFY